MDETQYSIAELSSNDVEIIINVVQAMLDVRVIVEKLPNSIVRQKIIDRQVHKLHKASKHLYKCHLCKRKCYQTRAGLKYHLSTRCLPEPRYQCAHCDYTAVFKSSVYEHLKNRHESNNDKNNAMRKKKKKKRDMVCTKCRVSFSNRLIFMRHRAECVRDDRKSADATVADSPATSLGYKVKILDSKTLVTRNVTKRYCSKCKEIVENEKNVAISRPQYCEKCNEPMLWQCYKCEKRYDSFAGASRHLVIKCYAKKLFECTKCDYVTSNCYHMKRHFSTRHDVAKRDGVTASRKQFTTAD